MMTVDALRALARLEHTMFGAMLAVLADQVSRRPVLTRWEALAALREQGRMLKEVKSESTI